MSMSCGLKETPRSATAGAGGSYNRYEILVSYEAQPVLPRPGPKCNAVRAGRRLQGRQRPIGFALGQLDDRSAHFLE